MWLAAICPRPSLRRNGSSGRTAASTAAVAANPRMGTRFRAQEPRKAEDSSVGDPSRVRIMTCQREACLEQGNHTVTVVDPAGVTAVSEVRLDHARSAKVEAMRSRPRSPHRPDFIDAVTAVECGDCRISLEESSPLPPGDRQPCPVCGSEARHVAVRLDDTLELSGAINAKVRRFGRGTIARGRSEDSFAHDLRLGQGLSDASIVSMTCSWKRSSCGMRRLSRRERS